jgi:UDP-N-acetylmuramoyl-tripeptide--D-alanyl-D-alanine ligase
MKLRVGSFEASGWSIDSRTVSPGDLFITLKGPNHDAHDYLPEVFARGAVAAVTDREVPFPHIRVPDTQQALEDLGGRARREWGGAIAAVTGSAGKTSTKDIVAAALAVARKTAKTEGNLNNHIGVPLTLLRIEPEAEVAVVEMGMNHAGEIRRLCEIARPEIGVVTNVGYAHIENFDSIEGIAAAKRELIESLPAHGTAVLNADDPRVAAFASAFPGHTIRYGIEADADVRARDLALTLDGASFTVDGVRFETRLAGRHSVLNLLAGISVARVFGIAPSQLADTYRLLQPGKMRGERLWRDGILIFNDCYNSNPDAVRAMLDVLRDAPAERRIAVLGEMLELGCWSEPLHRDIGNYAASQGVSVLVGIRGAARHLVDQARKAGLPESAAPFFDDPFEAGDWVRQQARPGDAILFKGSRGTHVEHAVERFLA